MIQRGCAQPLKSVVLRVSLKSAESSGNEVHLEQNLLIEVVTR